MTHLRIPRLMLLATIWALSAAMGAQAQEPAACQYPTEATVVENYAAKLRALKKEACLGNARGDPHPLVVKFNGLTNEPTMAKQTTRLVGAIDLLLAEAAVGAAGTHETTTWNAMLLELGRVKGALSSLEGVSDGASWLAALQTSIPSKWKKVASDADPTPIGGQDIPLSGPVQGCVDNMACAAFQARMGLLRVANLMARLQRYSQDSSLVEQFAASELALAQWAAYRKDGHHQYIWELAANSLIMDKKLCPEAPGTDLKLGFCKVPTSQLILLHPDVAMRWARTATKASELKPSLLVELVGWYWWDWAQADGRNTATMANRRGVSLAATYSQTTTEKRLALGPMFHYDGYNFALTKAQGGGKWSLVVNMKFGESWFKPKQTSVDELASVKKQPLLDLLFK
jgi:hypothetical protein